jgi:CRISPR-associated endonuclease Csn1
MAGYTLGLDIGANSIGWALIDGGKTPKIIDIGVRVFPEGVDRDTKGLEKSKNAKRREARGARRTRQRRNRRKNMLVKVLQKNGLLPEDKEKLAELLNTGPYELRKNGLDEKLELCEIGRVFFHINQRRGFKSNRKGTASKEDGVITKAAGELQQEIEKQRCRTLGEYFAKLDPEERRIRGHYTFRSMYEQEFDVLWEKQSQFYQDILTDDFKKKLKDEIIFFQRPLKPADKFIGDCELEEGKKRCPRGDWYARKFRILQDVNNLKIYNSDGTVNELDDEQRQKVLTELSKAKEVQFNKLRKSLGLLENQRFNFEFETNEKGKTNEKIKGDAFNASMRGKKVFGVKAWDDLEESEKIKINDWLVELDDDELIERLSAELKLADEQIESVLKISLPMGYMRFSRKAIQKLLPVMKQGKRTDEAIDELYPDRLRRGVEGEAEKLGLPEDLRNPLVNRALFEVRKVVNAIIREYGKPARVKIEMARDVKGNARERREDHFKMRENEQRNEEVRQRLMQDLDVPNPSRDDVIKYKLWQECGKRCPYTGKTISQNALFGSNPEFQVEHILPYSRSLDDSFVNKTLCCVNENRLKLNQTPYEYYSQNSEKFEALLQRVNSTGMPYWKKRRFWQKEIDTEKIISRELNDTRYICREVVKYLKQICSNVTGTRGKITAELRYRWGLIKDREDHRHHAFDAAVVAVTEPKHLRELGQSKYAEGDVKFAQPWPHFREELEEKVKHINVSHRPTRKVSGQLHEETFYGPTTEEATFAYRKNLTDLTGPMVSKIIDPVVRQIVEERLVSFGFDPKTNSGKPPKEVWSEPLYMKTTKSKKKVVIRKVRIKDVFKNVVSFEDSLGHSYKAAKPGNNHHVEIFEYTEGEKIAQRYSEVVTMFEAVRRKRKGEAVVCRNHGQGKRFICSLAINDMVMLKNSTGELDLYRIQKMDANRMIRFRHHVAANIQNKETYIDKTAHLFEGYKVTVDPLGRICSAND